jgi:Diadenosine tetraphosphate (Ap4A) hydrolase and other HIT family hydrolases
MSADCLFCKIAAKQIPAKLVHEDADVFAFEDINPQAPTHVLVCPKKHFASLEHATLEEEAALGKVALVAAKIAKDRKLASYRTVINTGSGAGQTVFHLHLHLLGGRAFSWPPG